MNSFKIAVGIIVDDTVHNTEVLKITVQQAQTFSDRIFILETAAGAALPFYGDTAVNIFSSTSEDGTAQKSELFERVEEHCSADYLLWLHPGERLDVKTFEEFRLFIENELERNSLYMLVVHRLHRPDGKRHDFDEETIEPRLIPLRKSLRCQDGNVSLIESAKNLKLRINAAPGRIVRFGGEEEHNRRCRYAEKSLTPFLHNAVENDELAARANAYLVLAHYDDARQCFQKLIETANRSDLRLAGYYGLWDALTKPGTPGTSNPNELTQLLVRALDNFPVDMQLLTWMGIQLQSIGKWDLAIRSYETALKFGTISLDVWHRLHIREIALTRLALLHRILGNSYEAARLMEDGLKEVEDPSELSRYLLDVYIAEENETKALNLAAGIWGDAELDQMRNVVYGACRGTAGSWVEALGYIEKSYRSGTRDILCLRWYALSLLSSRRFNDAVQILEEWLEAEPGNQEALSFLAAARQPEHFAETLRKIRETQLRALGVPKEQADKKSPKKNASIERAVREMICSSGGKISCFVNKTATR